MKSNHCLSISLEYNLSKFDMRDGTHFQIEIDSEITRHAKQKIKKVCSTVHKKIVSFFSPFPFPFPYQTNANLPSGRWAVPRKKFNAPVPTVKVIAIVYGMLYVNDG